MKKTKTDPADVWIVVRPDRDMHNPLAAVPTHRVEAASPEDCRRMDAELRHSGAKAYRESVYGPLFWSRAKPMPTIPASRFLSELQKTTEQNHRGKRSKVFIQEEIFLP